MIDSTNSLNDSKVPDPPGKSRGWNKNDNDDNDRNDNENNDNNDNYGNDYNGNYDDYDNKMSNCNL